MLLASEVVAATNMSPRGATADTTDTATTTITDCSTTCCTTTVTGSITTTTTVTTTSIATRGALFRCRDRRCGDGRIARLSGSFGG